MTARGSRAGRSGRDIPGRGHANDAREARLSELHQRLADGVTALRAGDTWRDWLTVAARFHTYSLNNQLLILAQNPHATQVAGYRAWQCLGRQVRQGENALYILAPIRPRRTPTTAEPDHDHDTAVDPDPKPTAANGVTPRRTRMPFRGAAVFDVTQTEGDTLPEQPQPRLLAGQAPYGLWDALTTVIASRGYTVTRCPAPSAIGGANGLTDLITRTVTVRADVDDAQAVKTLAHEAGHVLLHTSESQPGTAHPSCRGLIEVEAESVAYLVAAHHGLDTADYTFAYIAGWAGRDDDAVKATATRVLQAARTILEASDPTRTGQPDQELHEVALADPEPVAHSVSPAQPAGADAASVGSVTSPSLVSLPPSAGVTLHDPQQSVRRVLAATQAWFVAQAEAEPGYGRAVANRGHAPEQTRADGIGWAPARWTGLVEHLLTLGHTPDELIDAGVAIASRGRLLDRFRGRITFPLHDNAGAVVGWTARDALGARPDTPKYLNSPASGHYDKSRLLYGTSQLTPRARTVVLVEGPWDAYAVTRAAGPDTIGLAACGTAVTAAHLELATDADRTLSLGVDNDPAGRNALGRTLHLINQLDQPHPRAVMASHGKDLADQYAHDPAAVRADLTNADPAGLTFARAYLATTTIGDTVEARIGAARAAAAYALRLDIPTRARLAAQLMSHVGITAEAALAIASPSPATSQGGTPLDRGDGHPGMAHPRPQRTTAASL